MPHPTVVIAAWLWALGALLSPVSAPAQEAGDCGRSADPPLHEEGLGVLLDSAHVAATLAGAWERGWGYTIASVRFDSTGALGSVAASSRETPARALRKLEDELRAVLPQAWAPRRAVWLILGDAAGPSLRRVRAFKACAPSIQNGDAMNQVFLQELQKELPIPAGTARVMGFVDERGRITQVRLERSSGDGRLDRAALTALRRGRFVPATMEGIPVPVWTSMPMTARAW